MTGHIFQLQSSALEGPFIKVDVRVNEAGYDKASIQIDRCCVRAGHVQHIIVFTNGQNARLADGHRRGLRGMGILGGNAAVVKDNFRQKLGWCHSKNPLGKGSRSSRTN